MNNLLLVLKYDATDICYAAIQCLLCAGGLTYLVHSLWKLRSLSSVTHDLNYEKRMLSRSFGRKLEEKSLLCCQSLLSCRLSGLLIVPEFALVMQAGRSGHRRKFIGDVPNWKHNCTIRKQFTLASHI
jgi:hypothetical protein